MEKFSFLKHIEDLRARIVEYIIFLIASTSLSFIFVKKILFGLTRLINEDLVIISPQEGIISIIKIGFLTGFILSIPFLIFQLWRFISIALTNEESKKLKFYLLFSFLLFILGVSLAYFLVIPFGLSFLLNYGKDFFNPMISISNYISFVTLLLIIFGIIFQLPMLILFLNSIGVVSKKQLKEKRRHFYLTAFIIAAFFTPPDVITQIFMALALIGLYEISYIIILMRK